jgi:spore coat polysaccharide biosynthesis protein SpsF|tara:strand:- start:17594 stop:18328 length:735 start_codon:yes stop_codon:yes gene_type:complete
MTTVATIEARMTSSRLPGKVLLEANGKPLLGHLVQRLKAVPSIDKICLATTTNSTDDVLVDFAYKENISVYRGSESDVLSRVVGAAESVGATIIVEITGDCPIIDPEIVEQAIRIFHCNNLDYVSNAKVLSWPVGMDVQVFSLSTLKRSQSMTSDPIDQEHVASHIRRHPEIFSHLNIVAPPSTHWPELGLTLDERDDYLLIKTIIEYFGDDNPLFSCKDVVDILRSHPEWIAINDHVGRKGDE